MKFNSIWTKASFNVCHVYCSINMRIICIAWSTCKHTWVDIITSPSTTKNYIFSVSHPLPFKYTLKIIFDLEKEKIMVFTCMISINPNPSHRDVCDKSCIEKRKCQINKINWEMNNKNWKNLIIEIKPFFFCLVLEN